MVVHPQQYMQFANYAFYIAHSLRKSFPHLEEMGFLGFDHKRRQDAAAFGLRGARGFFGFSAGASSLAFMALISALLQALRAVWAMASSCCRRVISASTTRTMTLSLIGDAC